MRDWLDSYLDEDTSERVDEPVLPGPDGPPAHWLERVRQGAPELLLRPEEGGIPWVRSGAETPALPFAEPFAVLEPQRPSEVNRRVAASTATPSAGTAPRKAAREKTESGIESRLVASPQSEQRKQSRASEAVSAAAERVSGVTGQNAHVSEAGGQRIATSGGQGEGRGAIQEEEQRSVTNQPRVEVPLLRRLTAAITRTWRSSRSADALDWKPVRPTGGPSGEKPRRETQQLAGQKEGRVSTPLARKKAESRTQPVPATSKPRSNPRTNPQTNPQVGQQAGAHWPDTHTRSAKSQRWLATEDPSSQRANRTPSENVAWNGSVFPRVLHPFGNAEANSAAVVTDDPWPELPEDLPLPEVDLDQAMRAWQRSHRMSMEQRGEM